MFGSFQVQDPEGVPNSELEKICNSAYTVKERISEGLFKELSSDQK